MTVVAVAGTAAVGVTPAAADTTIKLTTSLDEITTNNGCSLREALMYASGSPEAECATTPVSGTTTIVAPAGCYRLTMGQLFSDPLRGPVVLQGAGPGPAACNGSGTVIDAQHGSRVLEVNSSASVSGLTVTGGVADAGGGIRTEHGFEPDAHGRGRHRQRRHAWNRRDDEWRPGPSRRGRRRHPHRLRCNAERGELDDQRQRRRRRRPGVRRQRPPAAPGARGAAGAGSTTKPART